MNLKRGIIMYKLNKIKDFEYLTFPIFDGYDELFHCFTTRKGGVSKGDFESMNLGFNTGDDEEDVRENYYILSECLNINLEDIVKTFQSHTDNIRYVTEEDKGRVMKKCRVRAYKNTS